MSNDVSIIIRVTDTESEKLGKVAARARVLGESANKASADLAQLAAAQQAAGQSAERMSREQERAAKKIERAHTQAIIEQRARQRAQTADQIAEFKKRQAAEISALEKLDRLHAAAIAEDIARTRAKTAAQMAEVRKREAAELAAQEKLDRLHAAAIAEDIARERAKTAAREAEARKREAIELSSIEKLDRLQTQAIIEDRARERAKTAAELAEIRKRELAEIASQEKLDRLHAAAIAEDIARERAKTAAIVREAEKQAAARAAAVRNFGTGTLSYAGVGFGANALGAGIATAGVGYFASSTSIEFERAEQAIAAVTGSLAAAQRQMAGVEFQAQRLGMSVTDLARLYSKFEAASKGTNLEGEKARDIFYAVAEAAQRLSLRGEQVDGVLRAIEQMMSKGKIQAEELRGQLGDRLPGAFQIMARSMNVTAGELDKMLKAGEVMADDVLPGFAAELRKTFNTDINMQIETTVSNFQRLLNEIRLTADEVGDRLNPALSEGASRLADMVAYARENPGATLAVLYGGGASGLPQLNSLADRAAAERRQGEYVRQQIENTVFNIPGLVDQAIRPGGSTFYGPGTPVQRSPIDLTAGVTAPDEKRMAALREELALLDKKTEYAKTLWLYTEGELKNANHVERALALQAARRRDELEAEKEAKKVRDKADKAGDRLAERDLKAALELEETERERVRAAMVRNAILEEEVRTGNKVNRAKRELIELEMEYAVVGNTTLRQELERADALERTLEAREFYSRLFDQMARDAERSSGEMSVYAERAAQNMQDTFAQFLFDPFENGVEGMVRQFADAMQRMAAEAAAAQIFEYLTGGTGLGGPLGSILGGILGVAGAPFGAADVANQDPFGPVQYLGLPGAKSGGYVVGPGGPKDDKVLARLSNGEYVMQASVVRAFGRDFFDALNRGRQPVRFAEGGHVGKGVGISMRPIVIEQHNHFGGMSGHTSVSRQNAMAIGADTVRQLQRFQQRGT